MERDYSRQEVLAIVEATAARYGIPKDDFLRASYIETGGQFNERAYNNSSGAAGLYQFMPDTATQYGISGREYDPNVNADAGARLYLDNQRDIVASHGRSGRPYLSGEAAPNGLDMYMAHQQGAYGYRSIQAAIDTGSFFGDTPTRRNILANVGDDLNTVTGVTREQFNAMSDRDIATTFVRYWETKYERIAIPEVGIAPKVSVPGNSVQLPSPGTTIADPLADGVLREGEKGPAVRQLQEQLASEKILVNGKPLVPDSDYGPDTKAAVIAYQRSRGLDDDGIAGADTLAALRRHAPEVASVASTRVENTNANWPAPGNFKINDADKAGEGHGEFGTPRSNRSGRHSGLDIEGKVGDRIEPFAAGKVVFAGQATGYGNTVVIDHGNGQRTLYAHLNTINVQNGQEVTPDTKIATMGRSGNTPSAGDTHLHFEIRTGARAGEPFSGTAVDPLPYLKNTKSIDAPTAANAMADGTLRQGERGPEVKKLQEQLNALHIKDANGNALIPDSDFGKHTKEAVRAFQAAHHLVDDGIVGKDTLAALKKAETALVTTSPASATRSDQSPLLSNPSHPDNGLYKQALAGMEKLPANTFKSELERQNAAAAVTFEAKVSGMTKIDTVALSTNGSGLFAVQGAMNDPGHNRIYVDKTQAAAQPVEKSTQQLQQDNLFPVQQTQNNDAQRRTGASLS